jgi:hypothetical protein
MDTIDLLIENTNFKNKKAQKEGKEGGREGGRERSKEREKERRKEKRTDFPKIKDIFLNVKCRKNNFILICYISFVFF